MRFRLVARAKNKQKYLYQYLFCPWNNFLSQISHGKIANAVRFSFGREWRKQMSKRSFSLKKAKTSKNAVFATGRDGGTRTHGLTVPNRARYQLRYISKFFTLRIVQPFYDLCQLYFYLFQYLFLLNKKYSDYSFPPYKED